MSKSINNAISISLNDNIKYNNLIDIEKNSQGEILMLTANTYKVNKINNEIVVCVQSLIENKINEGVDIPFMAFLGLGFFSGYGLDIKYKNLYLVSVENSLDSVFTSVGINQTKHSIYSKIKSIVNLSLPFQKKQIILESKVLLCESVLLGKVPDVYLNGNISLN